MIAAIRAAPEDDVRRGAYADMVEEAGDADLAKLIRVGVLCCDRGIDPAGMECILCGGKGWRRRCEHGGCTEPGELCYIERTLKDDGQVVETDDDEYFCGGHAHEHGYCRHCGGFFAGIESFDFSRSGLCSEC